MKAKIIKAAQAVLAILMMMCVCGGIILMMCESADSHTQMMTLFGGFGLFVAGLLPGLLISLFGRERTW